MAAQNSGHGRVSDRLKFKDLVDILEKISEADSNDRKKKHLQKYMAFVRKRYLEFHKTMDPEKTGGDSLYCVVRILIPDVDRGRRAYGFKSSSLGRMFAQILGLDKNSKEGKSLIEFKDPRRAGEDAGSISNIIFKILATRFSASDFHHQVTLSEIHETLDKLSKGPNADVNQEHQKKILQGFIRKLTPLEGKWLVRLLLKEMHLGYSSTKNTVYGLLHPQARNLSERIGDLELLCQKVNDPNAKTDEVDILLFNHFRPMLSTRMDIIDSAFEIGGSVGDSSKKRGKADVVSLPAPPFYTETKWDGERFQIHYDGHQFKYLSRRAHDYTNKFDETLTPKLRQQIKSGVKSFIVDGEMMAYHKTYKIFTQKGYNIDVKTINKDNPNHCPVFVAFDVVYFNGAVLTKIPLKERREKLKSLFSIKEDVVQLSEVKIMNTKKEVIDCLNSAIDDGQEGLIVKSINSFYEPGKRPLSWLKIKPEYLEDNSVDDLDLVILGAYYTDSTRRGGEVTHFLVGLIDTSKGKKEYYPIAKVGSGRLRSLAVKDLVKELQPKFVTTPVANVYLKNRKKPDFMIEPNKSVVVQVKASEIIPSDVYACNYTLRFPRIIKIRKDKSPNEILQLKEFLRIREACGGKLAKRTDDSRGKGKSVHPFAKKKRQISDFEDSDDEYQPSSKKSAADSVQDEDDDDDITDPLPGPSKVLLAVSKPKIVLAKSPVKKISSFGPSIIAPPKKSAVVVEKNVFGSKVFCVYGTSSWKTEMETKIRKHGGEISQSPDIKNFFAIIAEKRTSVLVRKAVQAKKYNVLQSSWIEKCFERGEEVPTVPLDYWGMTEETKDSFADEYDEYGDSYTKENTIEETMAIAKRMIEDEEEEQKANASSTPNTSPQKAENSNQEVPESSEIDDGNCSDSSTSTNFSENYLMDDSGSETELGEDNLGRWDCMSNVVLTFRGTVDDVLKNNFEFYGGKVVASEADPTLSHVIICKEGSPSRNDHSRALVVSQKWLEDCLRKRKVLNEQKYLAT